MITINGARWIPTTGGRVLLRYNHPANASRMLSTHSIARIERHGRLAQDSVGQLYRINTWSTSVHVDFWNARLERERPETYRVLQDLGALP